MYVGELSWVECLTNTESILLFPIPFFCIAIFTFRVYFFLLGIKATCFLGKSYKN